MSAKRSQAFTPEFRLHYHWEYRRFFNKSEIIRLSECTLYRIPNQKGHYRVGITIKARGNSVERNRVKRQIREYFRTHEQILGAFDYNVVVPNTKKMHYPYPQRLGKCLKEQLFHEKSTR